MNKYFKILNEHKRTQTVLKINKRTRTIPSSARLVYTPKHNTDTRICQNYMSKKNTYQNLYNTLNTTLREKNEHDIDTRIIMSM